MIIFWSKKSNGGYGDRLIGMGACIAIANVLGHEFKIMWDEDLSDLFDDYESSRHLPRLKSDNHYYFIDEKWKSSVLFETFDFTKWDGHTIVIETNQPIHYHLWRNESLKLAQSYVEVTKHAFNQMYSKYMKIKPHWLKTVLDMTQYHGIQLRFGDYYMTGDKNVHYLTPSRFKNLIGSLKSIYSPEDLIYLTTDNRDAYESLRGEFQNLQSYQVDKSMAHFDHTKDSSSLIQIILEHYTLAQTKSILTSLTSNFGISAGLIGGVQDIKLYHLGKHDDFTIENCDFTNFPRLKTTIPNEIYELPLQLYPINQHHKPIYLLCDRETYVYFEDYCQNLLPKIHTSIIIYHSANQDQLRIDNKNTYWFCNEIPYAIRDQIRSGKVNPTTVLLINTEQLSKPKCRDLIKDCFEQHIRVIDYDYHQSLMTQNSYHLYLPYQIGMKEWSQLRQYLQTVSKTADVAFCSVGKSARRQAIFDQLVKKGIKVIDVKGWGAERDRQLASAKILINIHYDVDYQIYEHMRCDRWLLAGQMVITEPSLSDSVNDVKDLLIIEPYDSIVTKVVDVLGHYDQNFKAFMATLKANQSNIINQRSLCLRKVVQVTA
jgi:hypothetical protein